MNAVIRHRTLVSVVMALLVVFLFLSGNIGLAVIGIPLTMLVALKLGHMKEGES